jgi:probable F420-dependent oxidoreductase
VKLGIHLGNNGASATADSLPTLATRAEELGFDSVWTSDHVVIPSSIAGEQPAGRPGIYDPADLQNYWEATSVLAFVAGMTKRVQLGVTVIVVPQREPLLFAKQWATLDQLSGGRTILGVGVGWNREEFEALGAGDRFDRRGAATDEAIRLWRTVWRTEGDVSFAGDVYQFDPIRFLPKPARPGGPPIWVGGSARASIRRAAQFGDNWHPIRASIDDLKAGRARLDEQLARFGRRPEDVTISMTVTAYPPGQQADGSSRDYILAGDPDASAQKLRRYAEVGVEHLVINCVRGSPLNEMLEAYEYVAREVRPRLETT